MSDTTNQNNSALNIVARKQKELAEYNSKIQEYVNGLTKFSFGPFWTAGTNSTIHAIRQDKDNPLWAAGFYQMQIISDVTTGKTTAVLLYNINAYESAVVLIPTHFASWDVSTKYHPMIIVLDAIKIGVESDGFTVAVPEHVHYGDPKEFAMPYSISIDVFKYDPIRQPQLLDHPVLEKAVKDIEYACDCGRFHGGTFRENICPVCQSKVTRRDFWNPYRADVLIDCYLHRFDQDLDVFSGTILRRISPPSGGMLIDDKSPWTTTYTLSSCHNGHEFPDKIATTSHYKEKTSECEVLCELTSTGLVIGTVNVGAIMDVVLGVSEKHRLEHSWYTPWRAVEKLIIANSIFGGEFKAPQLQYAAIDQKLLHAIDDDSSVYGINPYGIMINTDHKFIPFTPKIPGGTDTHPRANSVTLKIVGSLGIVTVVPDPECSLRDIFNGTKTIRNRNLEEFLELLYKHDPTAGICKLYLIQSCIVAATAFDKRSWSRVKLTLAFYFEPCEYKLRVSGILLRDRDGAWLAKTHILGDYTDIIGSNVEHFTTGECCWSLNADLLSKEAFSRKDPEKYLENFIGIAESLGINTMGYDIKDGQLVDADE